MFGHPANIDEIKEIIKNKKIDIIEDAAESPGSKFKNKVVGSFGKISCFSFYVNKLITTGEGGMALTNDKGLYNKMKNLRNLAFNKTRRFSHNEIGYNYRMTNIQAAIGLSQLEKITEHIKIKDKILFYIIKFSLLMVFQFHFLQKNNGPKVLFGCMGLFSKIKNDCKKVIKKLFDNKIEIDLFFGRMSSLFLKK